MGISYFNRGTKKVCVFRGIASPAALVGTSLESLRAKPICLSEDLTRKLSIKHWIMPISVLGARRPSSTIFFFLYRPMLSRFRTTEKKKKTTVSVGINETPPGCGSSHVLFRLRGHSKSHISARLVGSRIITNRVPRIPVKRRAPHQAFAATLGKIRISTV